MKNANIKVTAQASKLWHAFLKICFKGQKQIKQAIPNKRKGK